MADRRGGSKNGEEKDRRKLKEIHRFDEERYKNRGKRKSRRKRIKDEKGEGSWK